jgi:hypothetical protein
MFAWLGPTVPPGNAQPLNAPGRAGCERHHESSTIHDHSVSQMRQTPDNDPPRLSDNPWRVTGRSDIVR